MTADPPPADPDTADPDTADTAEAELHRRLAIDANNSVWELLGGEDRPVGAAADELLERAYAAAYHWRRAARRGPENAARASWLLSRVHAVLGHGDLALHHADRSAAAVEAGGLVDFDLAYAHEARARSLACLGRLDDAAAERSTAGAVPIADHEDRAIFESDLAAEPWFGSA